MTSRMRYEVGRFRLDPARRRLETAEGEPVTVTAKAFDALVHFVQRPGELVPRRVLLETVWPDTVVDENSLNQAIASLRRALGDGYIVTVPGRGYQLVADVRAVEAEAAPAPAPAAPAGAGARIPRFAGYALVAAGLALAAGIAGWLLYDGDAAPAAATIAVLPFENLSDDADEAYFSDGLADELITVLARVPGLQVRARPSSFALRGSDSSVEEIAELLDVEYLLGGGVARDRDRLRVRIQLNDASGVTVLARAYERGRDDVFDVQQDIARAVVDEMRVSLGAAPRSFELSSAGHPALPGGTDHVEAFDHYLRAQSLLRRGRFRDTMLEAVEHYEQALDLDPNFGLAQVGLATALDLMRVAPAETLEEFRRIARKRERAIARATALAPGLPAALGVVARQHMRNLEWAQAERALEERLLRSSDNDYEAIVGYGSFLNQVGRAREAMPYLERARRLNPLLAEPTAHLALAHDALDNVDRAFELDGNSRDLVGYDLLPLAAQFWRLLAEGDLDAAQRGFARAQDMDLEQRSCSCSEIAASTSPRNRLSRRLLRHRHARLISHEIDSCGIRSDLAGFSTVDRKAYSTLASLHNNCLFRAGALLIGSHAYGALLNSLGVRAAGYTTQDVDIACSCSVCSTGPKSLR